LSIYSLSDDDEKYDENQVDDDGDDNVDDMFIQPYICC
jgi:hypothetical protein